jgi:hypothetical protein
MQIVFLSLPKTIAAASPRASQRNTRPLRTRVPAAVPPIAPAAPDTAITLPQAARIDWAHEAETVAQARAAAQPGGRICAKGEMPDPRRPNCTKAPHAFEWNPETPRIGVDGIFPYVRVGDSCIVSLGFFACHEKMPANGHLFEEMKNPNRPESSVPEAPH